MNPTTIALAANLLQALPLILSAGPQMVEKATHFGGKLKTMIDENRDPTSEEWDEVNGFIEALR